MILSPTMLALARDRRKTQHRFPRQHHPKFGFLMRCPVVTGRKYVARCMNAGWTAAELRSHRRWAAEEMPSRARAVLAYLDDPLDAALTEPAPVEVTIMDTHLAALGEVDQAAAQREGFRFLAQFQNHWRSVHGTWTPDELVWVVTFEVGDQRHKFDRDLFMKATPGVQGENVDEHQDYTTMPRLAIDRDAPVVPKKDLDRFAAEGEANHARRHHAELRRRHVRAATKRLHEAERRNDPDAYAAALADLQSLHGQIGLAA